MKKSNTSKAKTPKSKKVRIDVNELSMLVPKDSALRFNITNDKWRAGFIYKFKEWGRQPNSIDLTEFLDREDIPRKTFYAWCNDFPDMQEAWENVKISFASHRRLGSVFNRMNGHWAHRGIEFYDEEEMRATMLQAEIKAKIAQAGASEPTHFTVIMGKPPVDGPQTVKELVDAKN